MSGPPQPAYDPPSPLQTESSEHVFDGSPTPGTSRDGSGSTETDGIAEATDTYILTVDSTTASIRREPAARRGLQAFRRIVFALVVADACCIIGTILVVEEALGPVGSAGDLVGVLLFAASAWLGVFHSFGLYNVRHLSPPEEFRRLISATTLGVAAILVGSFWWADALDRSTLALAWSVALGLEMGVRRITRWHIRHEKARGRLALRTVIVGANDEAAKIAETLAIRGGGFTALGIVTSGHGRTPNTDVAVLGSVDELVSIIERETVECVFVASTGTSPTDVRLVSHACRSTNTEMRVSANAPDVLTSRLSVQHLDGLMLLSVRPVRLTGPQAALKRSFDIALSATALIVLAPLMAMIALTIKLTSHGPVLFGQERVTKGGHTFTMYKFRTMVVDQERALAGAVLDITKPYFKLSDDPRLTRSGRWLRPFSLDELPQFWNVLRGDMSLVGPRPLPVEQVSANLDLLESRHEVRSGMTGWWQVSGRSENDVDAAIEMDLFYIENWSLSLDVYVLLKTVGAVLARRGAY